MYDMTVLDIVRQRREQIDRMAEKARLERDARPLAKRHRHHPGR